MKFFFVNQQPEKEKKIENRQRKNIEKKQNIMCLNSVFPNSKLFSEKNYHNQRIDDNSEFPTMSERQNNRIREQKIFIREEAKKRSQITAQES